MTGIYPVRISRERDKNSVKSLRAKMTAVKSFGRVVVAKKFSDSPATRYRLSGDFDRSIDRLPVKMTGNFFIGDFDPRDRGESEYTGELGLR